MRIAHHLAEIRNLAHFPEQADSFGMARRRGDIGNLRKRGEGQMIIGLARRHETGQMRALVEALQETTERAVIEPRVAPIEPRQRIEAVILDRLDDLGIEPFMGLSGLLLTSATG